MLPMRYTWHRLIQRWRALSLSRQIAQIGTQDRHDVLHVDRASALGLCQDDAAHAGCVVDKRVWAEQRQKLVHELAACFDGVVRQASMLPQPIQIGLDAAVAGCGRRALNNLGLLKESDELPNHADKSYAQDVRRPVPRTLAPVLCKPIDDTVVDVRDGDIRLIEPIAEMPGATPQVVNRGPLISTGDEMIDIRLNQRLQCARVNSPVLLHLCKR
jgi:hypothetical protein